MPDKDARSFAPSLLKVQGDRHASLAENRSLHKQRPSPSGPGLQQRRVQTRAGMTTLSSSCRRSACLTDVERTPPILGVPKRQPGMEPLVLSTLADRARRRTVR
ncbi:hypothetical protein B0T18DRAFT_397307 [Schizothecium vesticola]|uniref:Uncharacterized protein n=1 Tax=Schizothecium vesticola TaxID=314040 RepID=A0AA40KBZ7_9PEZI|nr:hypothetical protein B0T18DRAFT_397307 [Schizothecium vesticola]